MIIIYNTVFNAVIAGFFVTCIVEAVMMNIKIHRSGKCIPIKIYRSGDMWGYIGMGILNGLNAVIAAHGLDGSSFTEGVLKLLAIIGYAPAAVSFIMAFFLRTRAYITNEGIVIDNAFLPPWSVKYSVKTVENKIMIKLYTKRKNQDYTYISKNREAVSALENIYDEFDGTASTVKIKKYTLRYYLTLLCASLIFFGGVFIWYEIKKPVIFVGDRIVKTDSEYAVMGSDLYSSLLAKWSIFPANIGDGLKDASDYTRNIKNKDLASLKKLPNLKYLDLMQNNITDLTEIGELTQLELLRFGGGKSIEKPEDFSPLKNLTNIKYFTGAGLYNLNDLTLFEDMDGLTYFELTSADIENGLDVICEKENLLLLDLYNCKAEDFSPVGKSVKLKYLGLYATNVTDLSFLENLRELKYLDIGYIKAEDYSVLLDLPELRSLYAWDTEIPPEIIDGLTENGVYIYS